MDIKTVEDLANAEPPEAPFRYLLRAFLADLPPPSPEQIEQAIKVNELRFGRPLTIFEKNRVKRRMLKSPGGL